MRGPGPSMSHVLGREVDREAEAPHPPLRGTFSRGEKEGGSCWRDGEPRYFLAALGSPGAELSAARPLATGLLGGHGGAAAPSLVGGTGHGIAALWIGTATGGQGQAERGQDGGQAQWRSDCHRHFPRF